MFRLLAFLVANEGGPSGKILHLYFWVFFLLAIGVENVSLTSSPHFQGLTLVQDPAILSGIPCLAYFARIAGYPPHPIRLMSQILFDARLAAYSTIDRRSRRGTRHRTIFRPR